MVIVDLYSQRKEVAERLLNTGTANALAWLESKGELIEIPTTAPAMQTFLFRSNVGIETTIAIRDGKMVFIGDHTSLGSIQIEG